MSGRRLRLVSPAELGGRLAAPPDPETSRRAAAIVEDVRRRGEAALVEYAERLDGWVPGTPLVHGPARLRAALEEMGREVREPLERAAERIAAFAAAQRGALGEVDVAVPGGRAGHRIVPVERAGCYAPNGRFPLPSSVLMTAVTARVAGVRDVVVATPRPDTVMLAAAAIAGADAVLAAGGAQAVAAMACGVLVEPRDMIVGPGNRWVTAAKRYVAGEVGIDALAGPSELVLVADGEADPATVAADLLAQAEHDPDAMVALVVTDPAVVERVEAELGHQLAGLATAGTASAALEQGIALVCRDRQEVVEVCDRLAPEHLQLSVRDPEQLAGRIRNAAALFLGERSAVVLGDYGVGGNHTLPTGRGARFSAGLSVLTFLRVQAWLRLEDPGLMAGEVAALARLEGLEAHARAAERRR